MAIRQRNAIFLILNEHRNKGVAISLDLNKNPGMKKEKTTDKSKDLVKNNFYTKNQYKKTSGIKDSD